MTAPLRREPDVRIECRSVSTGTMIVGAIGELDLASAPRLEAALRDAIRGPWNEVVVDLSQCDFIDASVLRVLVKAHSLLDGSRDRLRLVVPQPHVRRLLEITELDREFDLYADLRRAIQVRTR